MLDVGLVLSVGKSSYRLILNANSKDIILLEALEETIGRKTGSINFKMGYCKEYINRCPTICSERKL